MKIVTFPCLLKIKLIGFFSNFILLFQSHIFVLYKTHCFQRRPGGSHGFAGVDVHEGAEP